MKIKFYRLIPLIISGTLIISLCGCSKEKSKKEIKETTDTITDTIPSEPIQIEKIQTETTKNKIQYTRPVTTEYTTVTTTEYTTPANTETEAYYTTSKLNEETVNPITYNENETIVLEKFQELGEDIKENINSEKLLEKGKQYFIYSVDFLFYDKEINGIKFKDLSEASRKQLINDINEIDDLICSKFPNYKEDISDTTNKAYAKASQIIKSGTSNLEDYSKEKIGEENYNKIVDELKQQNERDMETINDLISGGKEKVKTWYEGLK